MEVKFYDTVEDKLLKFAVIVAKSNGKWVFCQHKERDTYECPGGHREAGENIDDTALALGVDCVLFSGGQQSPKLLQQCGCGKYPENCGGAVC